jgi:hypothetical protein
MFLLIRLCPSLCSVSDFSFFLARSRSLVLQDTQEVVMAAVGNDGEALFFASERLKNDKTVAMIALAKEGLTHMLSPSSAFVF